MDNDKQITQWVQDPKSFFLAEDITYQGERPPLYILEEEFAKTKKNRPYFLYLAIFLVSALIVVLSLGIVSWYKKQQSDAVIAVEDFQDLNLKEVLESYAKSLDSLSQARFELENLRQEYRDFQARIRQKQLQEQMLINQQDIPEEEKLAKLAQLSTNTQKELKLLEEEYASRIKAKEEEIQKLAVESEQYGKQVGKTPSPALDDSTRKLYETRLQQQKEYFQKQLQEQKLRYEQQLRELKQFQDKYVQTLIARYNPVFATPELQEALRYSFDVNSTRGVWTSVLDRYGLPGSMNELARQIRYQEILLKRLLLIPYTNSVPVALYQVYKLSGSIVGGYESLGLTVSRVLDERDQIWKRTYDGLIAYLRQKREHGIVISGKQPAMVIVDPVYSLKTGYTGYVFRQDNQMIAKVRFVVSNYQTVFLDVIEWYDRAKSFEVFDRVVVNLKGE